MLNLVDTIKSNTRFDFFTDSDLRTALAHKSEDSLHSIVKRAVKSGQLIRLRRGLYLIEEKSRRYKLNLFSLAQQIRWPSYVSLESALSYYSIIPEAVYTIASVTPKRSKVFMTPVGRFSYDNLSSTSFFAGVTRVDAASGAYLIARPERALVDYIKVNKIDLDLVSLAESLRIEEHILDQLDLTLMTRIGETIGGKRVARFVSSFNRRLF